MSDEQTIYISPEDDLTTVRERLEHIPTRRVTLVVPAQTQLRSHVAWKLLYARARELGKEVLIVSSDPQVRSVAHAVKFAVAHSLESNQAGKSRPFSRPSRSGTKGKGPNRPVTTKGKGSSGLRGGLQKNEQPNPVEAAANHFKSITYHDSEPVDTIDIDDEREVESPAHSSAGGKIFGQSFDYTINTPPQIRPLDPEQIEEPDLLLEDYTVSQNIRNAARNSPDPGVIPQSQIAAAGDTTEEDPRPGPKRPQFISDQSSAVPQRPRLSGHLEVHSERPFALKEPEPSSQIVEQRGGVSIEGFETNEHEIQEVQDLPTSVIESEIEYQSNHDDILPEIREPARREAIRKSVPLKPTRENEKKNRKSPATGKRSATGRAGGYIRTPQQLPSSKDDEELAIEDRPTTIRPLTPNRPPEQKISRAPLREPGAVNLPSPSRNAMRGPIAYGRPSIPLRPSGSLAKPPVLPDGRPASQNQQQGSQTPKRSQSPRTGQQSQDHTRRIWIIGGLIIVTTLAIATILYTVPSSTITLTVNAQNYTHSITLTARPDGQQGAIPAQVLTQNFQQQGQEKATGTKLVDKSTASGTVCFSNNGTAPIDIPTGTIVETSNGVQFETNADASITASATCSTDPIPDPIQAVKAGESGNVGAGAITVIPSSSLSMIAQANNVSTASLKLGVTNTDNVTGGGVQPYPAITNQDLTNAKQDLHKKLQSQITNWLKTLPQNGAQSQVYTTETLVNTPGQNTVLTQGTTSFQAELQVKASVLYVSQNSLRDAAVTQLNTTIRNDTHYNGYAILGNPQTTITLSQIKQTSKDANAMQVTLQATGKASPNITQSVVQDQVKGLSPSNAQSLLEKLPGVKKVDINVYPSFIPVITLWGNHINVTFVPETANK